MLKKEWCQKSRSHWRASHTDGRHTSLDGQQPQQQRQQRQQQQQGQQGQQEQQGQQGQHWRASYNDGRHTSLDGQVSGVTMTTRICRVQMSKKHNAFFVLRFEYFNIGQPEAANLN